MKTLLITHSYHHLNTKKVADAMNEVLKGTQAIPEGFNASDIKEYDLIGFGAGIDSGHHYNELIDFAKTMDITEGTKCFIFSTSAIFSEEKMHTDHAALRDILTQKGFEILGEFSCKGHNTNSFLKFIGGMNKGRPNEEDLDQARSFADSIIEQEQVET